MGTYEEFKAELERKVRDKMSQFGYECVIEYRTTKKNQRSYEGMTVKLSEDDRVGATVYPEMMYEDVSNGKASIDAFVKTTVEGAINRPNLSEIRKIKDYDAMKDKLRIRAVSGKNNDDYLSTVQHIDYLDIAAVPYVEITIGGEKGAVNVTSQLLKAWGKSIDEVFEVAKKNMIEKSGIVDLGLMAYTFRLTGMEEMCDFPEDEPVRVHLKEHDTLSGGIICCPDYFKPMAEKYDSDLYIIPSSIHELITMPTSDGAEPSEIQDLVKQVNAEEVRPEDFLSDSVYVYRRDTNTIEIAIGA